MKTIIALFCFSCLVCTSSTLCAQESSDYLERSPVYDYTEVQLNNTDTIPGFDSKVNKLMVTGTVFQSDGVTPAKDVIIYIDQADEHGDFDLRKENDKRYVHHRGWVKTDAQGKYTFYTFVPGNDRRLNQLQQLFPTIKEPSKEAYEIEPFLFDEDPLLTKLCRKRLNKKGDPSRILKLKKVDGLLVTQKDIVLNFVSNSVK